MYNLNTTSLGEYDVAVLGGGIAGTFAAISAARQGAKVIIVERSGSFGGVLTEGFVPRIMDSANKGGLVRELFKFLDERGLSGARSGEKDPKTGRLLPGDLVDTEACKYFFDKMLLESGVKVLLYSQVASVEVKDGAIKSALIVNELGNYTVNAKIFIDATGSGHAAAMAGCKWECGHPKTGVPHPVSMGSCVIGYGPEFAGTNTEREKTEYGQMLLSHGIKVSAEHANVITLPSGRAWTFAINFGYGVNPDDGEKLSQCTIDGRSEIFETMEAHRKIPGYENLTLAFTSAHAGIREGRRIFGEYRITNQDIIDGKRFEDGVCLVTAEVDIHKMSDNDSATDYSRGVMTKPYNIPYRALVAKDIDNLILAGRCISGDFFPHSSYRLMGNMSATGEAAGFAAANCAKLDVKPSQYDGKKVREFMQSRAYAL